MERAGQAEPAARPAHALENRTALILYGSETGNAQDVAEEVGRLVERQYFDSTVLDLDSVQLKDLAKATIVVFAISTQGQGEMPQNARLFWKTILSSALKPGVLRRVRFTSFGLGDSSYAQYNVAHRMLHGRLVQLGAKAFTDRGEGNEQHPEGFSAGLREWTVTLKQALLDHFPLPDNIHPRPDDEFLQPKWKLRIPDNDALSPIADGQSNLESTNPSTALLPVKGAFKAHIQSNERVTAADHFQDVRLLDLRLDRPYEYGPGALAVIYPKNFPRDVQDFIELQGWQDVADRPIALQRTSTSSSMPAHSPLRHLDMTEVHLTLRWLLENILDFMSVPRRSFFASLVYFVGEGDEDEKYQKDRLLELANPELIDELWDYTTRPKRTILEVMMDFTRVKIPWEYALFALPTMRGRQFSISSGGHLREDDRGNTRVELLIAIADPPSPIIKYRKRYGVCTRYVATLLEGQDISLGMQTGYLDVKPDELEVPLVMVGPGTGLAPMRSLIWQRVTWSKESGRKQPNGALKGDLLIFGCRAEAADYYFRQEWDQLREGQALQTLVAFSRDKNHPRQYVQDQIRLHGVMINETVTKNAGKIYICGSAGNMPKGVREALVDVLEEHGQVNREEAETYLTKMEKEGRYKQETW